MDEIFGEILGCGFGSDSIMLKLLKSAMDKAHVNVQSTDGSIELLNARSKFYELAMILVEGCSKLIEEKAEVPEINRKQMLTDLMESRVMVRRRLEELQLGMVGKDRELMERLESEWKLRQTLEFKERELVSLRAKLELERSKSEELKIEGFVDEGNESGDIRELKNSVDQQVWSIKQKLEDERIGFLTGGNEFPLERGEFEITSVNQLTRPEQKVVIEQMSTDIDGLKGTLDLAFGKMQSVEMRPLEKQWGWKIEEDTMLILIKGFMRNLEENFAGELEKRAKQVVPAGFLNENWGELIDEITCLHRELGALCCSNEVEVKMVEGEESLEPSKKMRRASSEPLPDSSFGEEPRDEDNDADGSHYVAKMIKSHESIIRKQREELNQLKREILREKEESLSIRRLEDPNNFERRIQEVIARLDNVVKWKAKIGDEKGKSHDKERMSEELGKDSVSYTGETELNDEIRRLKHEIDDSNLEIMMMEVIYAVLFKGLMKDFSLDLHSYETEIVIRDDVYMSFFREMDCDSSGTLIKKEINQFPVCESLSRKHQEVRTIPQNSVEDSIESLLTEDVYIVFFREMVKEWEMEMDACNFENLIREEIYNFLIAEALNRENYAEELLSARNSDRSVEACGEESLIQKLDSLLKCVEVEEDLMMKASSEIKEHSANNDLVASECEEVEERDAIEWLLTEEENTFCSVSEKLEKALQQLVISKELLKELQESLGIINPVGDVGKVHEGENSIWMPKDNQLLEWNQSDPVFSPLLGFQHMVVDFESMVQEKLEMNFMRWEELAHQIYPLIQLVASLRKRELLYKKAFSQRCHNLRFAETEVDLLGDQVDVLVALLEKIYLVLHQYSPVLSRHFGVYDILRLIKKELSGVGVNET